MGTHEHLLHLGVGVDMLDVHSFEMRVGELGEAALDTGEGIGVLVSLAWRSLVQNWFRKC